MAKRASPATSDEPGATETLRIEPATRARWADVEALFEARGSPHFCWCMVWRDMPNPERKDKTKKKAAFKSRIDAQVPVGLLAYDGDAPVAWVAVGPRHTVPRLTKERSDTLGETIWTISCFFVKRPYRKRGLTARLIEAAAAYAKDNGARLIEAHPVEEGASSYRFLGFTRHFATQGFTDEGRGDTQRHLMRRAL